MNWRLRWYGSLSDSWLFNLRNLIISVLIQLLRVCVRVRMLKQTMAWNDSLN